ncbi:MAG: hydantoinase/oxoprolinase family protein [Alphaproteobacteria bacterium]|nr:hydantoinase/oxoprolinase family protein [Alphaproteobacteria bacterium]
MSRLTAEVGVDTGGTFTDVVCRLSDGRLLTMKLASTPANPAEAVLCAVRRLAAEHGVPAGAIRRFAHGTTVPTNAVLERKGAKIGLIATKGFRDVLELGRQLRQQLYDAVLKPQTPVFLAPGERRLEVGERVGAGGQVIEPLDEVEATAALDRLAAEGCEAVAVALLFSFLAPAHERRIAELAHARHPGLAISLSCEVDPAFREYERTAATAFDAYIKPVVERYLARLEAGLVEAGVAAPLQVMQSRGGLAASATARRRPVRLFLSGPAAGAVGAARVAREAGLGEIISVDIGGTSCDIALIGGGEPLIRPEGLIDGFAVRVPMVDVNAIGAGGGSIAWLDPAGGLRVGPQSAGADPGPAAYGRGGRQPTVTDASLLLGYLDPGYFAGGSLGLDAALARAAVERAIARPLGLSVEAAALGIHRVLNAGMAEGIRLVSIRQGYDPRRFALVPLGGGGALHAVALAQDLDIPQVLVPRHPGVLSAAGLLEAPIEHEVSQAFPRALAGLDLAPVKAVLAGLDAEAGRLMAGEAIAAGLARIQYFADVCYVGQSHHLEVPLHLDDPQPLRRLYGDFLATHDRVYGYAAEAPARLVNLRSVHRADMRGGGGTPPPPPSVSADPVPIGRRPILLPDPVGGVVAAVFRRERLGQGAVIAGPAIVEQADTTTLLPPGWRARVLVGGHLMLTPGDARMGAEP